LGRSVRSVAIVVTLPRLRLLVELGLLLFDDFVERHDDLVLDLLHSLAAAPYAISLAQENQARLSLLYVIKDAEEKLSPDILKTRLQELIPAEAELWCRPNCFVRHGFPEVEILDLARERAVDLIVLGVRSTHGIPGISTHLPWAIAHRVVNQAHCPVLTVRG